MNEDIKNSKIVNEFNRQINSLYLKLKLWWDNKDKIEKTLLTIFAVSMIIGISILGLAGTEVVKNKDCKKISFYLTSIEDKELNELNYKTPDGVYNNIAYLKDKKFIVNGIENNTNVSYEVSQQGMDVFELREMFPNGEYYINMCPEKNINGETEYIFRGLINVNKINKFIFGRN